jgi:hypothetical protein
MLPRYEALPANDQIRVTRRPHRHALVAAAIVGLIIAAVISGVRYHLSVGQIRRLTGTARQGRVCGFLICALKNSRKR